MPKLAQFMDECLKKWSKDVERSDIEIVLKDDLNLSNSQKQEPVQQQITRSKGRGR